MTKPTQLTKDDLDTMTAAEIAQAIVDGQCENLLTGTDPEDAAEPPEPAGTTDPEDQAEAPEPGEPPATNEPVQLTADDLKTMTPKAIDAAHKAGQLNKLLKKGTKTA